MHNILKKYLNHKKLLEISEQIRIVNELQIQNLITSARSLVISVFSQINSLPVVVVINDKEEAAYLFNDIQTIIPNATTFFFPATIRHQNLNKDQKTDKSSIFMRTETMTQISKNTRPIIITYPEAIAETVISYKSIKSNTIDLEVDNKIEIYLLIELLQEFGFVKTEFVYEPGQYAVRGSIVDVFSYASELPFRIDFFGNEIESIRTFDIENQLSIKKLNSVSIINNIQIKGEEQRYSFLEFINKNTLFFIDDFDYLNEKITDLYNTNSEISLFNNETNQDEIIEFIKPEIFIDNISKYKKIYLSNKSTTKEIIKYEFFIQPQVGFQKNFKLLSEDLQKKQSKGIETYILSNSEKQLERLKEILHSEELGNKTDFIPLQNIIHEGFTDLDLNISLYTDHQIFNRYHRFMLKNFSIKKSKETLLLKEINDLKIGDYVVHIDHGVGVFNGLTKIENDGKIQEVVRITYQDNDNLFVNIHSLHKISKFKNQEGEPPKINKLGTKVWQNLKEKTKSKVKDIAKDLIKLYAQRLQEKGFAFSPDTYIQEALEASFIYEETPDQIKIVEDIKADMEKDIPMDRLVCGDVGFGKTEIAIRAAFKAVTDKKQVALLCPTTILAYQHYKTFSDRVKDFPITVEFLSRMKTAKQQREILNKLIEGKIDILIGTHRIVSKDILFNDLGLLVIDEEQKFGVSVKERLKQIRVNVDTLTLTATPIPRTMQFSLMGARDLSILQTPPPNRQPIITELHTFNSDVVKNAINYEVKRGGQVFFVHNHIETLPKIKKFLLEICPDTSVQIAHGQLNATETEKIITDFVMGNFDILLTTSIIENGLDIPNANTIIINNAHKFGLSDLHQLRGRVGRSSRKAFCYIISPPRTSLNDRAKRRLKAIENFVELGSGFNIALQDLDIRGAGDMLGAEQSGFINDIGYETFKKILEEAMLELRTGEYKQVFTEKNIVENQPSDIVFVSDCQITTDLNIGFADNYIVDNAERLKLYRQLDNINKMEDLAEFEQNLIDRFGDLPDSAKELINIVKLRYVAMKLGIEKITLKNKTLLNYFVSDKESVFYESDVFLKKILTFVTKYPHSCEMKERNERLYLKFDKVDNINEALKLLNSILLKS